MTITPNIWAPEFLVNIGETTGTQSTPDVTALDNGNFLVVWTDGTNNVDGADGSDIIGQRYDALGQRIGGPIQMNGTFRADNELRPVVTALPGGGWVVVYIDDEGTNANQGVRFSLFNALGQNIGDHTVESALAANQAISNLSVNTLADGSFVVGFELQASGLFGSTFRIDMERYSANGTFLNDLLTDKTGSNLQLATGVLAADNPVMVLASPIRPFSASSVSATYLFGDRAPTPGGIVGLGGATFAAGTDVTYSQPQVAGLMPQGTDDTLHAVMVWTSNSGAFDDILFGIDNFGEVIKNQTFITNNTANRVEPKVVALLDGGFFVGWTNQTAQTMEGQRFDRLGNEVGQQITLAAGSDVRGLQLDLTGDGRILVTWAEATDIRSLILDPRVGPQTGTNGNDVLVASNVQSTISGLGGQDTIIGSNSNDTLFGGAGNDLIRGRDDNDRIDGGSGNDTLRGENGNDTFIGGLGNDRHEGGEGRDTVDYAGSLAIRVDLGANTGSGGNAEGDTFLGIENVNGSGVTDRITGDGLVNILRGQDGFDTLNGAGGNDTLEGGAADDTLIGGAGADSLFGGTGHDTADYRTSAQGVTINFLTGLHTGGDADGDRFNLIERVRGSDFDDTIIGNNDDQDLFGGNGNDTLDGQAGADSLFGGNGDDTLDGGAGIDSLIGGFGHDVFVTDGLDTIMELANEGLDTVLSSADVTLGANLENITLNGSASINGTGNTLTNRITGNSGNNTLNGGGGADVMLGGIGNDIYVTDGGDTMTEAAGQGTDTVLSSASVTLGANLENITLTGSASINGTGNTLTNTITGNSGNNTLNGGGGSDTMLGGAGNDTYVTDGADAITEAASQGTDTVQASINFTLTANFENLELTGTASLSGTGNTLNNRLTGNSGNNSLNGTTGADVMLGGAGNDTYVTDGGDTITEAAGQGTDTVISSINFTLTANFENLVLLTGTTSINGTGNTLANTITGNGGTNTVNGGLGNDNLTGGAGTDSFVFNTALGASNIDRITDFNVNGETIRLENTGVFTTLAGGTLTTAAFVRNTSGNAADASDRIIYESDTGRLFFDRDGTGGAAKVHFATLNTNLAINHADFFVF